LRAGAYALSLLATPLNVHVLRTLEEAPRSLMELRRVVGSPPQTTLRSHLRTLADLGVVDRHQQDDFPGSADFALGPAGKDFAAVADMLEAWLARAPEGALALGSPAAKGAIKALVKGWSSTLVRAIAARPLALTELDRLIVGLNYPSLERRLGAMRLAGQIEACDGRSRSRPYTPTEWLRRAMAPLLAGAAWERRSATPEEAAASLGKLDFEAAFLLAIPLLELPKNLSGVCRLVVELPGRNGSGMAGAQVSIAQGRPESCVTRLGGEATAWAVGSAQSWLQAVVGGEAGELEIGGDHALARAVLDGLHQNQFGRSASLSR
jgi:DNA-binding HxlR family transcriptional regulator